MSASSSCGCETGQPAVHPDRQCEPYWQMREPFRRLIFAVPFGCLVAIATHFVRFGEEHAFGGRANEALVAGAVGGALIIALLIVHAFLTSSTTTTTGTIAAARARQLIPGAPAVFAFAMSIYYGIEALEGNGIELGLPAIVLAALAVLVSYALRRITETFALFVADQLRNWLARLDRRERLIRQLTLESRPLHSQIAHVFRRFGRAPPNGQRFSSLAVS